MKANYDLCVETLDAMKGKWTIAAAIGIIYVLVSSILSGLLGQIPFVGSLFSLIYSILVLYPISFALVEMFVNFVRQKDVLSAEKMFKNFGSQNYWKIVILYLLMSIFIFLWTLLLIIPGIIKALSYAMAPYILNDNPDLTTEEAIAESEKMMDGHKMQLFLLSLGYIGLAIASIIFLFIPMLWIVPYYQAVFAKFYEEVRVAHQATLQAE